VCEEEAVMWQADQKRTLLSQPETSPVILAAAFLQKKMEMFVFSLPIYMALKKINTHKIPRSSTITLRATVQ